MSTARNMDSFAVPPEMLRERRLTPKKMRKRREQFAIVPMGTWYERLQGASGATWQLAVYLIHLHWKGDGKPIKLTNGMLGEDGISRWSKYHGLRELEHRGLASVEWRPKKSPIVTPLLLSY